MFGLVDFIFVAYVFLLLLLLVFIAVKWYKQEDKRDSTEAKKELEEIRRMVFEFEDFVDATESYIEESKKEISAKTEQLVKLIATANKVAIAEPVITPGPVIKPIVPEAVYEPHGQISEIKIEVEPEPYIKPESAIKPEGAIDKVVSFGDGDFIRQVGEMYDQNMTIDEIAEKTNRSKREVSLIINFSSAGTKI